MLERLKKYKEVIGLVIFLVVATGFGFRVEKAIASYDDLVELEQQNAKNTQKIIDQFSMILALAGLTPERIAYVKSLPQYPVVDSAGKIVFNKEWLYVSENMTTGYLLTIDSCIPKGEKLWPQEKK